MHGVTKTYQTMSVNAYFINMNIIMDIVINSLKYYSCPLDLSVSELLMVLARVILVVT